MDADDIIARHPRTFSAPPDVPALEPDVRGANNIKDQLALENFDVIGGSGASPPNAGEYAGFEEFRQNPLFRQP